MVKSGKQSERDFYMEYMNMFETQEREGQVSYAEFEDMHKHMSCAVSDNAEYLECLNGCYKC